MFLPHPSTVPPCSELHQVTHLPMMHCDRMTFDPLSAYTGQTWFEDAVPFITGSQACCPEDTLQVHTLLVTLPRKPSGALRMR